MSDDSAGTVPAPEGGLMHLCPRCDHRLVYVSQRQEEDDVDGHMELHDVETWRCPNCSYEEDL